MRYDPEHKQRTREKILTEAAAALRRDGPDRIAVAGVMARAGLTHGGFYAHFASKEDLLVAAVSHMFTGALAHMEDVLRERTPQQGMLAYIGFYLSDEHRDRRDCGCPLPAMAADMPRLGLAAREAFERGAAQLTTRLAEALAPLVGAAESGTLAVSVLAELVGAVVLARSIASAAHSSTLLRACREALARRLLLRA
jgi:TetR/AcrR family transcriptional regulator, transcriptional repressor for nem operon